GINSAGSSIISSYPLSLIHSVRNWYLSPEPSVRLSSLSLGVSPFSYISSSSNPAFLHNAEGLSPDVAQYLLFSMPLGFLCFSLGVTTSLSISASPLTNAAHKCWFRSLYDKAHPSQYTEVGVSYPIQVPSVTFGFVPINHESLYSVEVPVFPAQSTSLLFNCDFRAVPVPSLITSRIISNVK